VHEVERLSKATFATALSKAPAFLCAAAFLFFSVGLFRVLGPVDHLPHWSLPPVKMPSGSPLNSALRLDRLVDKKGQAARVPDGVSSAAIFGSCASCSDFGPWKLSAYSGAAAILVIVAGKPAEYDADSWNLPPKVLVLFDPSLDALGEAVYSNAPVGIQWDNKARVIKTMPIHAMFEGVRP
jgi:hypothetical protein